MCVGVRDEKATDPVNFARAPISRGTAARPEPDEHFDGGTTRTPSPQTRTRARTREKNSLEGTPSPFAIIEGVGPGRTGPSRSDA